MRVSPYSADRYTVVAAPAKDAASAGYHSWTSTARTSFGSVPGTMTRFTVCPTGNAADALAGASSTAADAATNAARPRAERLATAAILSASLRPIQRTTFSELDRLGERQGRIATPLIAESRLSHTGPARRSKFRHAPS